MNFTVIDTTFPIVTGVINGGIYNSKSGIKYISFDKGTATLNAIPFLSGDGVSATGNYTLTVTANNVNSVSFVYIKYGDVNGDGAIDVMDLTKIKKHLLKIALLTGVYNTAGNIYEQEFITISDLLAVKKQILGISQIF